MYTVLKFLLILWGGAERWQKCPMCSSHLRHINFSECCIRSVREVKFVAETEGGQPVSCPGAPKYKGHLNVTGIIGNMALVNRDFHTQRNVS